MPNTARAGLPYPALTATPDVPRDLKALADATDNSLGAPSCTSTTRPTAGNYVGRLAFETDTKRLIRWDGTAWAVISEYDTGWQDFAPKGYSGGGSTVVSTTLGYARYRMVGKTVTAYAQVTFNAAATGGAAVDLPVPARDRVVLAGSAGVFGSSTPADQSGAAYMDGSKTKLVLVAYTQGFRDASSGHAFRYHVTYEAA